MKQFMQQQLSKRQLGLIRGGKLYECVAFNGDEKTTLHIDAEDAFEAADKVHEKTGADQVNCTAANSSSSILS